MRYHAIETVLYNILSAQQSILYPGAQRNNSRKLTKIIEKPVSHLNNAAKDLIFRLNMVTSGKKNSILHIAKPECKKKLPLYFYEKSAHNS